MISCVVKLDEKDKKKKTERWQKIAEVAAKQSGRNLIPKINQVISIKNICNLCQKYDIVIVAYENEKNEPSISTLKHMAEVFNTSIDYLIGYTDIRQPLDKISQFSLTEDEYLLLNGFRNLSARQKYIALGVIMGIKSNT